MFVADVIIHRRTCTTCQIEYDAQTDQEIHSQHHTELLLGFTYFSLGWGHLEARLQSCFIQVRGNCRCLSLLNPYLIGILGGYSKTCSGPCFWAQDSRSTGLCLQMQGSIIQSLKVFIFTKKFSLRTFTKLMLSVTPLLRLVLK